MHHARADQIRQMTDFHALTQLAPHGLPFGLAPAEIAEGTCGVTTQRSVRWEAAGARLLNDVWQLRRFLDQVGRRKASTSAPAPGLQDSIQRLFIILDGMRSEVHKAIDTGRVTNGKTEIPLHGVAKLRNVLSTVLNGTGSGVGQSSLNGTSIQQPLEQLRWSPCPSRPRRALGRGARPFISLVRSCPL